MLYRLIHYHLRNIVLEHCTEGHLIPEIVARSGCPAAIGPTMSNASKIELANKSFATPDILARAGTQFSIITDAPVIPQQYLPLCAGLAVKAGMNPLQPSRPLRPTRRSIWEIMRGPTLSGGKDAELVVTDGDPMVSGTNVLAVFWDGRKVVDAGSGRTSQC